MKKLALIMMAALMALAMTACSNTEEPSSTPEEPSSTVEPSSVEEEEPSSEEEETSSEAGDLNENISQPPTGVEDEPEEEVTPVIFTGFVINFVFVDRRVSSLIGVRQFTCSIGDVIHKACFSEENFSNFFILVSI